MTQNLPKSKAQKRLDDAAKDFVAMLERMGGGSVSINGVEIVNVPDSLPPKP